MLDWVSDKITNILPQKKIDIFQADSLLFNTFPYYMLIFLAFLSRTFYMETGNSFIIIFIIYSLVPLFDEFFSLDTKNPNRDQSKTLERQGWKYDLPLYLTVLYDWYLFYIALQAYEHCNYTPTNTFLIFGLAFMNSNLNSAQFAVAHQLMHKPGFKRFVGTWHMIKTLNIHFTYEHVFGHHRKVATEEDASSAEKGINVYRFFIRSYFAAYPSVYYMEKEKGKPLWKNNIIISVIASLIFCSVILYFYSIHTFCIFIFQVIGAVFYLDVINYIEHYGLRRKKLSNGSYEKVTPRHSWNSPHRFSNYLFFKLQRHSDHHENAMKPYQTLLTIDEAPQLPHGYVVMTVLALFPAQFMRIMDPLVDEYNQTLNNGPAMQGLYKTSVEQTRKFVMKITVFTFTLLAISYGLM